MRNTGASSLPAVPGRTPVAARVGGAAVPSVRPLQHAPGTMYFLLAVGALAFGFFWRRWLGQGPFARVVAAAAGRARQAVRS